MSPHPVIRRIRTRRRLAAFVLTCLALAVPPSAGAVDSEAAAERQPAAAAPAPRLALQPCVFPERFERCRFDCERQERHIERRNNCTINTSRHGLSTCRELLVDVVRQCLTDCYVDYCPQFNP